MNWEQFRAIIWVRWRLTRNQLTRGSGLGAVFAALATAMLVTIAISVFAGGALLGALALKKAPDSALMFVGDAIVFFVLVFTFAGVLSELQRSESVDLTRLLHLPISLKQVFVFNYLASLVGFGTIVAVSLWTGLTLGLVISHGFYLVLMLPLIAGFMFMLTAWVYCLRGWLVTLFVNPRRRRAIIMWITIGFIGIAQTPQLLNLVWQRQAREQRERQRAAQTGIDTNSVTPAPKSAPNARAARKERNDYYVTLGTQVNQYVPLLWLPNGMRALASRDLLPALWGTVGMFALGWLGISRSYRSTLRFYRGEQGGKAAEPEPEKKSVPGKPTRNWVAARLPWLAEDTAALALAQCRSMSRAPEVRMMLAMALFFAIFMPLIFFWRSGSGVKFSAIIEPFAATAAMVLVLFTLLQLVCNQFGCDRDGFRGIVLLPTRRDRVLFGKNLALFPLAGVLAIVPLVALSIFTKLSPLVIAATVLQFSGAFLMYCALGNLASILMPFRIAAGSLKPTKQSWQTIVGGMLVFFSFPVVVAPVFIPPALGLIAEKMEWLPAGPVNFVAALLMAAALTTVYALTLKPLGRLFQRRETQILRAVTDVTE